MSATQIAIAVPALAHGSGGFRYIDRSQRLPASTNPPDTDTLDVDLADVDGDGDLDIFVVEGTASPAPRANALWINDGTGRFADQSASRLPPGPPSNSTEVDFGDIDGDGDLDAVVANLGPNQLLLNDGFGHFMDVSAAQLPPPDPNFLNDISAEARFADVDGDGDLDILVSNENPFNPSPFGGGQNRLLINDGTGSFADETAARLPARTDQTAGFAVDDIDDDGDLDLVVINIGQEYVLINDGTGVFQDATDPRMPITTDSSRKGVFGDLNGDGCRDLFVGNSRAQQNRVYLNNCRGAFADVTGLVLPAIADTTTDVDLADFDGDGDLDAYIANAGAFQAGHGFLGEQNYYLENDGGRFRDRTRRHFPQRADPSTNAELGDVDGDGDLDVVVANSTSIGGEETLYIRAGH